MKKLLLAAVASAALFATPANAKSFWPWGFVGFEVINFGVTNAFLLVCQGRVVQSPQEVGYAFIPVLGPVQAMQTCGQRRQVKR